MHTEMKYRFLIHYTLSFIGGYLGLYAIVSRADLFGNAQTANLLGVVRDLIGRNFSTLPQSALPAVHSHAAARQFTWSDQLSPLSLFFISLFFSRQSSFLLYFCICSCLICLLSIILYFS